MGNGAGTVWIRNRYTDEYRLKDDPEQLKAEAAAAESIAKARSGGTHFDRILGGFRVGFG